MNDKFEVKKEDLIEMLHKAFDEGWNGYPDLKESVCLEIIKSFESRLKKSKPATKDYIDKDIGLKAGADFSKFYTSTWTTNTADFVVQEEFGNNLIIVDEIGNTFTIDNNTPQ